MPLKEICQKVCASHDRGVGQWVTWKFIIKVEITMNSFEKWFSFVARNCGGDLTVPSLPVDMNLLLVSSFSNTFVKKIVTLRSTNPFGTANS